LKKKRLRMRIVQGDFEATPNENYCSENNNDKKKE